MLCLQATNRVPRAAVPCFRRVRALESDYAEGGGERTVRIGGDDAAGSSSTAGATTGGAAAGGDEWLEPSLMAYGGAHGNSGADGDEQLTHITSARSAATVDANRASSAPAGGAGAAASTPAPASAPAPAVGGDDDDEYADMSDFTDPSLLIADPAALRPSVAAAPAASAPASSDAGEIVRVRSYTVSICYDKYYQTPRVYLRGFSESGVPLTPDEMLEDVMQDYAQKTATIDPHPHEGAAAGPTLSIHPCRHAAVMKRIIDSLVAEADAAAAAAGPDAQVSLPAVESYLFIFLKFIASMIPTIEYDYTTEVAVGRSTVDGAAP